MQLVLNSISKSLSPALKAYKPPRTLFNQFKSGFTQYLDVVDHEESEENLKTHLMTLLGKLYGQEHLIEQMERVDFVVRIDNKKSSPAGVLFEHKRSINSSEMISTTDCNRKAMHELVLYYMQERSKGNTDIKHLVICTEIEFFIFQAKSFERAFFKNTKFRASFHDWKNGLKSDDTTDFFYNQIAKPHIAKLDIDFEATFFDLNKAKAELASGAEGKQLLKLFKILGPQHLLMSALANDSNSLNKAFYDELLFIIGLEEKKEGGARIIDRLPDGKRSSGSLIENTIAKLKYEEDFNSAKLIEAYGANTDTRAFGVGLELCLTWINRLLFLKLLEAQIVKFHGGDATYKFLNLQSVPDFDELSDLFFMVLAIPQADRPPHIQKKFGKVPYLNSSLFEKTELEKILGVGSLNANYKISPHGKTVLKDSNQKKLSTPVPSLSYMFEFLDSYDFGAVGGGDIQEESKTIINASVLGLIFEKINGYKEGAIFTPGYITMYMSRQVIEKTVLEAFAEAYPQWTLNEIDDLNNQMDRSKENILTYNAVIDDLKICDPAVGSGHFLVSCLNEIIALKSRLRILADSTGKRVTDYEVTVDNDELIILKSDTDEVFSYQVFNGSVPKTLQSIQETIFHEKQKVIENCLFGVDINPNSVRICQLRLWIELLKSAYYRDGNGINLETLPNIDINIKVGNSLLSRFGLEQNLSLAFNKAGLTVTEYRQLVADYKASKDKAVKRQLNDRIARAKERFQAESLGNLTKRIDAEIAQLKADAAQAEMFVMGEQQLKDQAEKVLELQSQISAKEVKKAAVVQNKTFLSALEWRFEFPEVLDDKGNFLGFDIIIANPPYMRVQEIEATQPLQKRIYEDRFTTAKGSYDLANLFFELSGRLAKPSRHNNIFIFPHKLFNSANGEALREYLMNQQALKCLTHFGANQIFDSAITYTCIALFNAHPSETFQFRRYALGADYENDLSSAGSYIAIRYTDIAKAIKTYGKNQWIFFDDPLGFVTFDKIFRQKSSVSEKFEDVFQGIATSKDALYICRRDAESSSHFTILVNPKAKAEKVRVETKQFKVEKQLFRPFLMGSDVHRYETLTTDRLVFFPYLIDEKTNVAKLVTLKELKHNYPLTHAYVTHYEKAFKARERGKAEKLDEWYAYIYPKNLNKFDQTKLTSMEICSTHPNVTVNSDGIYHATTLYSFVKDDETSESYEYFGAILNSNLFWWFLKTTGDTLQGDARRVKTNYVNPFPLPEKPEMDEEIKLTNLTKALIKEKAKPTKFGRIQELETEINEAVYSLYGLGADDIAMIERTLNPDLVLV
jgi:adenine-specific DNA-methyltransferase|tara:strand:+ start:3384 stop:7307 length:3924 start_codon:yes stop_codon:yes gene_type:complete